MCVTHSSEKWRIFSMSIVVCLCMYLKRSVRSAFVGEISVHDGGSASVPGLEEDVNAFRAVVIVGAVQRSAQRISSSLLYIG